MVLILDYDVMNACFISFSIRLAWHRREIGFGYNFSLRLNAFVASFGTIRKRCNCVAHCVNGWPFNHRVDLDKFNRFSSSMAFN